MVVVVSNNITIVTVKGNDYEISFWNLSKTEAVSRMNNANLNEISEQLYVYIYIYIYIYI